ncbi:hypothetical protein B0J14DRAFT_28081 [Halenospora varia]|nr:hypothetical protein B0J14DRAFT_28081 [Halenospora varia]
MVNSILSLPVRSVLIALLAAESLVNAQLATFANTTSHTTSSSASKVTQNCCFFLQDTINEYWWEAYGTTIFNQVVNLTSITQYLTPLPNGTVTSFKTNVYTTNATFTQSSLIGQDPVSLYGNNAPGPVESTTVLPGNGDKTVVGASTVTSPAAFFVYNTVKVITAAPVTNSNGDLVCGTVFSYTSAGNVTFSGVNSNAQAYWGGSNIAGPSVSELPGSVATTTFTNSAIKTQSASTFTNTYTVPKSTTLYTNSAGQLVTASRQAGVTITLDAPFVYQPPSGATGKTGETGDPKCNWGTDSILYGMTPQTLIDYMIKKPALSSQYPGLESCGIAYPSIIRTTACSAYAGHTENAGGDLTSSTVIIVGVTSSAASGVLTTIPAAQSQTQSATEQPTTSAQPTTSPAAVSSSQPTTAPAPVSSQEPATSVQPTTQIQPTTSQAAPSSQQAPSPEPSTSPASTPVSVPVSSQEPAPVSSQQPASSQAPAISSQNPPSTLLPAPVSSSQPTTFAPSNLNLGSIIGSLVGLSPASTPTSAPLTTVPILATVPIQNINTASPISGSTT